MNTQDIKHLRFFTGIGCSKIKKSVFLFIVNAMTSGIFTKTNDAFFENFLDRNHEEESYN